MRSSAGNPALRRALKVQVLAGHQRCFVLQDLAQSHLDRSAPLNLRVIAVRRNDDKTVQPCESNRRSRNRSRKLITQSVCKSVLFVDIIRIVLSFQRSIEK